MEQLIRFAADGLLLLIILGAGIAGAITVFRSPRVLTKTPLVIMAGLTSLLAGKLLSLVYQPSLVRPYIERGLQPGAAYIDNPGFPSDHALLATVVILIVYFVTPYKRLSYILALLLIIMAAARVLAFVHTPLDVVGGVLVGLAGGIWYFRQK